MEGALTKTGNANSTTIRITTATMAMNQPAARVSSGAGAGYESDAVPTSGHRHSHRNEQRGIITTTITTTLARLPTTTMPANAFTVTAKERSAERTKCRANEVQSERRNGRRTNVERRTTERRTTNDERRTTNGA
mgnify:CR=1 FL=1